MNGLAIDPIETIMRVNGWGSSINERHNNIEVLFYIMYAASKIPVNKVNNSLSIRFPACGRVPRRYYYVSYYHIDFLGKDYHPHD